MAVIYTATFFFFGLLWWAIIRYVLIPNNNRQIRHLPTPLAMLLVPAVIHRHRGPYGLQEGWAVRHQ